MPDKASLETRLGNLILRDGLLDRNELVELLSEFHGLETGELFGQFLTRKGILSKERLELLLIRQSAARAGGPTRKHVKQAMDVAQRTSQRIMDDVEDFMASTKTALAKVGKD